MIEVCSCVDMDSLSHGFGRRRRVAMDPSGGFGNSFPSSLDGSDGFYSSHGDLVVDLQRGRLAEGKPTKVEARGSPAGAKRRRAVAGVATGTAISSAGQVLRCQVQGCNLDLSWSKEYHKRHKVCDAHSKTPKVIVNGFEKRFCQQCSRFHLLGEFDEAKRSCRKRLAGHNERRRKPQLSIYSGRSCKLLPVYQGCRFFTCSTPSRLSFGYPDIFSSGHSHDSRYGLSNSSVKVADDFVINSRSHLPAPNHLSVTTSSFYSQMEEQPPYMQYMHTAAMEGICHEKILLDYTQSLPASPKIFQNASGGDPFLDFDVVSSINGLQKVPDSSCALSLLSSQSLTSTRSSVTTIPPNFMIQGTEEVPYNTSRSLGRPSNGHSRVSFAAGKFSFPGTNYGRYDHINIARVPDICDHRDFGEVHTDGMGQVSDIVTPKEFTVDMLQLSSLLRNVEHQRQVELESWGNEFTHWNHGCS